MKEDGLVIQAILRDMVYPERLTTSEIIDTN